MSSEKIKGKTAAIIGLIISILSFLISGFSIYLIFKNDFAMIWGLLALISLISGGFALISIVFSGVGRSKMKKSGVNSSIGTVGVLISFVCIAVSGSVIVKGSMMKPIENIEFNGKDFDKQKNSMDSLLNALDSAGDTTSHKNPSKK